MVRGKDTCDGCKRLLSKRSLVKMKGYGKLCYRCRENTPEYKTGFCLPWPKYLKLFFNNKTKNKGDLTK